MKWLKTYKIFESKEDIIQTVKDILLPISDLDYTISVTESPLYHQDFNTDSLIGYQLIIRVVSWGDQSLLITDDIKQDFITMKDYLESEGYNSIEVLYHLATPGSISSRDIKEFDDFMKYEPWQKVKIQNLLFVAKKIE
jgi:hypothetical protein